MNTYLIILQRLIENAKSGNLQGVLNKEVFYCIENDAVEFFGENKTITDGALRVFRPQKYLLN